MLKTIVTAALLVCFTPAMAKAATIDYVGLGKAEVVSVGGVRTINAWAGELNWIWLTGQPDGLPKSFYSYCVDLTNNATDPQGVTVRPTDELITATTNGAQKAAWLFNTYAATIRSTASSAGNAMAAGLQLAIWEVLYDNVYNLTAAPSASNQFYATTTYTSSAALNYGTTYLNALTASANSYLSADAVWIDANNATYGLAGGPGQDQITHAVPEPASLVLLGSGLLAVMVARRKKAIGSPAVL